MMQMLADFFTYLLAIFGLISLVYTIAGSIRQRAGSGNFQVRLALIVKNQQDRIEGIVRNVFSGDFLGKTMAEGKLMILDLGSEDDTLKILEKLKEEYGHIEVIRSEEREKIFECFEEKQPPLL